MSRIATVGEFKELLLVLPFTTLKKSQYTLSKRNSQGVMGKIVKQG
jgi:hypothetical protein